MSRGKITSTWRSRRLRAERKENAKQSERPCSGKSRKKKANRKSGYGSGIPRYTRDTIPEFRLRPMIVVLDGPHYGKHPVPKDGM